jgi:hypothetical protein
VLPLRFPRAIFCTLLAGVAALGAGGRTSRPAQLPDHQPRSTSVNLDGRSHGDVGSAAIDVLSVPATLDSAESDDDRTKSLKCGKFASTGDTIENAHLFGFDFRAGLKWDGAGLAVAVPLRC